MRFRAPFDRPILGVSIFAAGALGFAAVFLLRRALDAATPGRFVMGVAGLVALAIVVVCWALAPTAFLVGDGTLVIERPVLPLVFPLADLVDVRPAGRWPLLTIRVGNGGLFAVHGWFWNRERGWFRVYGRKARGAIVLTFGHRRPLVLMPENPEQFVAELRKRTAHV